MRRIKLGLRFLTPAFTGGPDRTSAELRPPTIKGMLRFWWRALQAENPGLKSAEGAIFGDGGGNGKVSRFMIRVQSSGLSQFITKDSLPRNKHTAYTVRGFSLNILEYLAYGTYTYDKTKKCNVFDREYIKPGFRFDLMFLLPKKEQTLEELLQAFRVFFWFGGLGAKSRNGFGSFTVEYAEGHTLFKDLVNLNLPDGFESLLRSNKVPQFTAFSANARLFRTRTLHSSWDSCLAELGHAYRNSRLSLEEKHIYKLRQFIGAPIIVNKRQVSLLDRRAKPYFLRVHQEGRNYVGYILYLPSRYYLGSDDKLQKAELSTEKADRIFAEACQRMNEQLAYHLEEVR